MAEAGVSFLLENVTLLVKHQVELHQSVKDEFRMLQDELISMKAILKDAAEKPRKEENFKAWERQVREVVYNAEDTIDSWISEGHKFFAAARTAGIIRKLRNDEVKPAFDRFKEEFKNMPRSEAPGRGANDIRNSENKPPRIEGVVGFGDVIETLLNYAYAQDVEELDIISIIGMAGLGKTTVAWQIYNHPRIQDDFAIRIWIYVSLDFNRREILLKIMKNFTSKDLSTKSELDLCLMVKKELNTHKFILFMDDVWTEDALKAIKEFLPMENRKGKVFITSRKVEVGIYANKNRVPHKLRFLNDKESIELLQIETFGSPSKFPEILVPTCTLIADQCGGLPLAIIVIGGVLGRRPIDQAKDETRNDWVTVSTSVGTYLRDDTEQRMEKFIALSYTALLYHLKDCFLYMGLFPEDAAIPAWKLKQMWIAEGFIQLESGKSLEQVAQKNLQDLIHSNLVQVDTVKPNGEVKTCRLHDTIRDFCINEAAAQNLFQEISESKEGSLQPSIDIVRICRRLCIHSNVNKIHSEYFKKKKVSKARALLCFSKDKIILENQVAQRITYASDMLRVLEMSNTVKFLKFPSKVSEQVHLRYISLSMDQLNILPGSLSLLWNLQTILIDTLSPTLEVKANLWKMLQLRHFKTKASVILKGGDGAGSGTLRTLSRLSPESCTDSVFKNAKNLNTLGICGDLNKLVFDATSFAWLEKLEKLKLYHEAFPVPWKSFRNLDRFPTKLNSLTLRSTYLEWTDMYVIGRLNTLKVLKLKENACQGKHWCIGNSGGFDHLAFLHIEYSDLMVWEASTSSFPELTRLVLKNCENLVAVPEHIGNNLCRMYLERVRISVAESARDIETKKNAGARIPVFKLVVKSSN